MQRPYNPTDVFVGLKSMDECLLAWFLALEQTPEDRDAIEATVSESLDLTVLRDTSTEATRSERALS